MRTMIRLATDAREVFVDITPQVKKIFFCECDGSRQERTVVCTILEDTSVQ